MALYMSERTQQQQERGSFTGRGRGDGRGRGGEFYSLFVCLFVDDVLLYLLLK
jgi:hypothetical protein